MYCRNCGIELTPETKFCPSCGIDNMEIEISTSISSGFDQRQQKIHCPKCISDQITDNPKGFSVGKAIGGAVLTGGIGILAGFHKSSDTVITCLNCGHKFTPGEGIIAYDKETYIRDVDTEILNYLKKSSSFMAIQYCISKRKMTEQAAKKYVENIAAKENLSIETSSKGCASVILIFLIIGSIFISLI